MAAACASWFDGPTTKFANVCFGFRSSGGGPLRTTGGGTSGADGGVDARRAMARGRMGELMLRVETGASRLGSTVHATWTDQPVSSRIFAVSVGRKFALIHSRTNS